MANFIYTTAKKLMMVGGVNLGAGGDDIRVMMVMTDTTCDTEEDKTFIDQFTTLDEMDGANNARKEFASEAVTNDDANDRAEFDAIDVVWTALGNGARQVAGYLVYLYVTNDTDSVPLAWIEDDTPFNPGGGEVTVQWNTEGIMQLT